MYITYSPSLQSPQVAGQTIFIKPCNLEVVAQFPSTFNSRQRFLNSGESTQAKKEMISVCINFDYRQIHPLEQIPGLLIEWDILIFGGTGKDMDENFKCVLLLLSWYNTIHKLTNQERDNCDVPPDHFSRDHLDNFSNFSLVS